MQEKLQHRLQLLKSEFEEGQKILAELETKQTNLRQTLLRISGAIQVLEEVLSETSEGNGLSSDMPASNLEAMSPQNSSEPLAL
ncbi:hypothetical protein [Leptolyngbya sp. GGD]|uniref:hypothetical protein n=1 Tax=Leptolyngbya sp. GGD TaxID=2997907 RepID=UPI00227B790C|nr:hypothetical protein [Leptolyngbya sp. GGD]MCY6493369.1 hypothetical protein [Leptolyngbya sp. GGD]